jgi:hypothetical protein
LLTNWRERGAHSGNVVGGEATVELTADIVARGANVGAGGVAERERVFARGAQPPIASRVGHFELQIHCIPAVSANIPVATLRVGGAGGEAEVRGARREAGAMVACFNGIWQTSHDRTTHTVTRTRGERPL